VCSYLTSWDVWIASPSQCWIPAKEQLVFRAQIAPFKFFATNPLFIGWHYALVCTPTETKKNTEVSIGNAPPTTLGDVNWTDNVAAGMSFYCMPLEKDSVSYTFTNPAGLIILCYGNGFNASYYYLAGSAMRELDAAFYANDAHFQDLKDTTFCANEAVNFRAELDNMGIEMDSIKWDINGLEETSEQGNLIWSKTFLPGSYEIKMWVLFENEDTISRKLRRVRRCFMQIMFIAKTYQIPFSVLKMCISTPKVRITQKLNGL
jgi:hypothetical protein